MAENRYFTTEQAAQALGISKQTLLRYEKKRVFPKPRRNPINQWRQYMSDDIKKLKEILRGSVE
ncbi:MAG: MerR family transcriptional regulator [Patescibacteria group bacterium]